MIPDPLKQAALDSSFLFSDLDLLTAQLHRLGIQPGDRIATLLPPCPQLIALFFAAWRLRASVCPLNLRLPRAQIDSCLARLSPKLFIDSFPLFPPKNGTFSGDPSSAQPLPSSSGPQQSIFLFTSGSTGRPKIAVLSLENLIASASAFPAVNLESGDKWLLSLPLFHVGGIGIVLRCILARAAIAFDERDSGITHLSYVPTQLYRATPIYKNLKCLLLGGAPTASYPERLPVYMTYGLTEMGSWVVARKHPPCIDGRYYLGQPLPGREVRLSPDGEILVRGKTLFQGYWENGSLQPPQEWHATGDIGALDGVEGLTILGRKDWQFISGGENIQPEEIEQQLLQIPEILEAAVVPKNDAEFGQRPAAFIKCTDPFFNLSKMQSILKERLPKYKIPIALFHLNEMPKNGLKTNRKALFDIANGKT